VTFTAAATDTAGNPLDGDGNGAGGDDLVWSFTTVVDDPPIIDLWEPGGTPGQSYIVGDSVPIIWDASDDNAWPNGGNVINISYNINPFGGNTISILEFDDGIANWDTTLVPLGTYYVNITVYDSIGQLGGSYSNSSFDIVPVPDQPPTVSVIEPAGGESWSGGTSVNVDWSMSDDYSSVQNLVIYVNYSSSSGSGTIAGPLTGLSSPASILWDPLPLINATDVIVLVDVIDEADNGGSDVSPQFEIDSTPPILDSHSPWIDETNVATNTNINVEWREPMNATATEASFTLSDNATWTAVSGSFFWGGPNLTSSFNPDTDLLPNSWYTANFTSTAKDDSNPGNNMASLYSWSFMTAAVPDGTPPAISNILAFPNPQEVNGSVSINASISDTYGIAEAFVLVYDPSSTFLGNFTMLYDIGSDTYFFDRDYDMLGIHTCAVGARDNNGNWNVVSLGCAFSIIDTTPPGITEVTGDPDPVEIFNWINVSAVVTDNVVVANVRLYIWNMAVNYTMDLDTVSGRYYDEHLCMMLGPHDYTIWAFDSSGNVGSYDGNFTTVDTELPQITHTPPGQAEVGQTIDFQATVTDNYNVDTVWLDFTDTSSNHFLVEMSNLGGDLYQLTVPGQAQEGLIVYHIWASDESGNGATTLTLNVSVVNVTVPVDDTAPMPPYGLTAEEGPGGDSTVLDWEAPVLNEDMTPLDDLAGYHIYRSDTENGPKTRINAVLLETAGFIDDNVGTGNSYYYWVTAVDESGNESNYSISADISFVSDRPSESFDIILLLLIIIIIAIVLLAVVLLVWRKKKQDTGEETPVEELEEPPSEEGTELE
jgi:hypothetical protein